LDSRDLTQARLVIFDLDGTLVDTLEPTFRCFQEAVAPALGRVPTREEILQRFGPADHQIVSEWVGPNDAKEAVERLYRCYETAFAAAAPFPGIVDVVRELRSKGKQTAIFTGRGRRSTDAIVTGMRLNDLFDAIVTSDEVERPKPAADGLIKIMKMLNVKAREAVYVGDTVKDVEAARAAKTEIVAALWGSPEAALLKQSDALIVENPEALGLLLGNP
jgi:HAD superfamily hydrolase (TIGR01549 family)